MKFAKFMAVAGAITLLFVLIYQIENQRQIEVTLEAQAQQIKGDGNEKTQLVFLARELDGTPLTDHLVELVLHGQGFLSRRRAYTDQDGRVEVHYQSYRVSRFNPSSTVRIEAFDVSVGRILEIRRSAEVEILVTQP